MTTNSGISVFPAAQREHSSRSASDILDPLEVTNNLILAWTAPAPRDLYAASDTKSQNLNWTSERAFEAIRVAVRNSLTQTLSGATGDFATTLLAQK